jgi:hypothetical protein
MLHRAVLLRNDVSEERMGSIIKVKRNSARGTILVVTIMTKNSWGGCAETEFGKLAMVLSTRGIPVVISHDMPLVWSIVAMNPQRNPHYNSFTQSLLFKVFLALIYFKL